MATGIPNVRPGWAQDRTRFTTEGLVYYLERMDGAIKIGCTRNFTDRRYTLRRRHGPLNLIAWEFGYYAIEEVRHEQFAALRLDPIAEWFRPESELIDHVLMLRALL